MNRSISNPQAASPKPQAFTLVELLVVVAIIVILIAILMPSLEHAVGYAMRAKCLSQERQIMFGGISYAMDNNSSFAPVVTYGFEYQLMVPAKTPGYNVDAFTSYLQTHKVFYCPGHGATVWPYPPENLWDWQTWGSTYGPGNVHVKHIVDYWLYFLDGHHSNGARADGPYRTSNVADFGGSPGSTTALTCWPEGINANTGAVYPQSLHGREGLTTAFVDGHAEWVPRKELTYDARPGHDPSWLKAVRRPWIGQTSPHSSNRPLEN